MIKANRRTFFLQAIVAGSALASVRAIAQTQPKVAETDAQAAALGYKEDSKTVDKSKFPKHEDSQVCANCMLFQGKPDDAWGGCALFSGKQVAGPGWCSAWVKKPA